MFQLDFLLALLFTILPVVLITGLIVSLGKRADFYEYILLSAGSVLVSFLGYHVAYSLINGQSIFVALWASTRETLLHGVVDMKQLLSFYHQMGIFKNFTAPEQLVDFTIGQLKTAIPAAVILFSMVYGVALFLLIRQIRKWMGHESPRVPSFEEWTLPRGMVFGLILLLLAAILGQGLGIPNLEVVQFTISSLISFLFTVLGLSVLWYFLKAGRVPTVLRWVLSILGFLFLGFALPFLGLFDQLFRIRWNYRNKFLFKNGK